MEIQTIMALIALAAVIVGPLVSLEIAKRQIRAQLVSANRAKWIEEVRTHVAAFLSAESQATMVLVANGDNTDHLLSAKLAYENLVLLLNPSESLHFALANAIGETTTSLMGATEDVFLARSTGESVNFSAILEANKLTKNRTTIHTSAVAALKAEWERIKRGE